MSKSTRKCQWCGEEFPKRRGRICGACENRTRDDDLYVLLNDDRSGFQSIHERLEDAQAVLKDDAARGIYELILRKVVGQSGARAEVRDEFESIDPREREGMVRDYYEQVT